MDEAIRYSKNLISLGFSIDLGLAQINSNNLPALNISVDEIFDPCTNLQAMQKVFLWGYDMKSDKGMTAAEKRLAAISRYNTGNKNKGVQNGYVQKVLDATNLVDENKVKTEEAQVVITLESEEEATGYVQDGFSKTRNIN